MHRKRSEKTTLWTGYINSKLKNSSVSVIFLIDFGTSQECKCLFVNLQHRASSHRASSAAEREREGGPRRCTTANPGINSETITECKCNFGQKKFQ